MLSSHDVDKDVAILDADETDDGRKWSRRNWWNGIKDVAKELCVTLLFFPQIEWNDHMFMLFICSTEEKWHVTLEILTDSRDVLFAQIKWNEMLQEILYSLYDMIEKIIKNLYCLYFLIKRLFGWLKKLQLYVLNILCRQYGTRCSNRIKREKKGYYFRKKQSKHSTAN